MSTNQDAVSPLRRRLIEDMTIRHLTAKTQGDYIRHVRAFAVFLRRSPDLAEPEDLRRFQLHMAPRDRGYPEPARRRLPAPSRRASGPRPAQGDLGHPILPHGVTRRPCRALHRLRPHRHRLQLLSQPPLPEVPGRGGQALAHRARSGSAARAVLPRGVHVAVADRRHRVRQQGRGLRSAVQGRGRDDHHGGGGSEAPRRPRRAEPARGSAQRS